MPADIDYAELADIADLARREESRFSKLFDAAAGLKLARQIMDNLPREYDRILDIGCGVPWLLRSCVSQWGMTPLGLNEPDHLLARAADAIHVPVIQHLVAKYEPLPDLGRLELVTAIGVNFYSEPNYWGRYEYHWLVGHLRELGADAIYISPNRGPNTDDIVTEDFWRGVPDAKVERGGRNAVLIRFKG